MTTGQLVPIEKYAKRPVVNGAYGLRYAFAAYVAKDLYDFADGRYNRIVLLGFSDEKINAASDEQWSTIVDTTAYDLQKMRLTYEATDHVIPNYCRILTGTAVSEVVRDAVVICMPQSEMQRSAALKALKGRDDYRVVDLTAQDRVGAPAVAPERPVEEAVCAGPPMLFPAPINARTDTTATKAPGDDAEEPVHVALFSPPSPKFAAVTFGSPLFGFGAPTAPLPAVEKKITWPEFAGGSTFGAPAAPQQPISSGGASGSGSSAPVFGVPAAAPKSVLGSTPTVNPYGASTSQFPSFGAGGGWPSAPPRAEGASTQSPAPVVLQPRRTPAAADDADAPTMMDITVTTQVRSSSSSGGPNLQPYTVTFGVPLPAPAAPPKPSFRATDAAATLVTLSSDAQTTRFRGVCGACDAPNEYTIDTRTLRAAMVRGSQPSPRPRAWRVGDDDTTIRFC